MKRSELSTRQRLLFVTRKYPPSVGGMETLAAETWRALQCLVDQPQLIALGRGQRHLLWWLPMAVLRTVALVWSGRATHVLCGDALVHTALRLALPRSRATVTVMVHGLDLTFPNPLYQRALRRTIVRADSVVANSEATAVHARTLGIAVERTSVLLLGVTVPPLPADSRARARARARSLARASDDSVLLVTLGRLVRRKGTAWFVRHVLPQLPPQCVLLIAGTGPEHGAVASAAAASGVADRVRLLGRVDEDDREALLGGCDLFVMPNIRVPGDMEGFGLVAIEAALRGTPVLAAELEGIRDAVVDGVTGILLPSAAPAAWIATISPLAAEPNRLGELGNRFAAEARRLYSSDAFSARLRTVLESSSAR